ncbi:hypothetical protein C4K39_1239 [Pseudomonas sessilinigenes]|nr:hypothetical protein C4K39_1239 [Pseudomonas sessilinigenes]
MTLKTIKAGAQPNDVSQKIMGGPGIPAPDRLAGGAKT